MDKDKDQYKIKVTNSKQFECLVNLIEETPSISQGYNLFGSTKAEYRRIWSGFASKLNSLGPPIRNPDGWLKVWNDYKNKIKKKLIHNKKEFSGGSSRLNYFSTLEEKVIKLLALDQIVNLSDQSFSLNNCEVQNFDSIEVKHEPIEQYEVQPTPTISNTEEGIHMQQLTTSKRKKLEEDRYRLLKEQTKILKEIDGNIKEGTRLMRKTYKLKKEKLALYKEYLGEKIRLHKQRNEAELKLLQHLELS